MKERKKEKKASEVMKIDVTRKIEWKKERKKERTKESWVKLWI